MGTIRDALAKIRCYQKEVGELRGDVEGKEIAHVQESAGWKKVWTHTAPWGARGARGKKQMLKCLKGCLGYA